MAEIPDLERNKPEVSEYNKKEKEMKGFDPCLLLKGEWWCVTRINEQMGVLMEEKKGDAAACDQLMCERRNVTVCLKGFLGQRDELHQEIQSKIAERQKLILKEKLEVVSLARHRDCRVNRLCASASEFARDRQSGLAPPLEQNLICDV